MKPSREIPFKGIHQKKSQEFKGFKEQWEKNSLGKNFIPDPKILVSQTGGEDYYDRKAPAKPSLVPEELHQPCHHAEDLHTPQEVDCFNSKALVVFIHVPPGQTLLVREETQSPAYWAPPTYKLERLSLLK